MILTIAKVALAILAAVILLRQCRKPWGWLGRFYIWLMNLQHAGVTSWGLSHVRVEPRFAVLDVGCGGGKAVERLAVVASEGKVCGIDYSPASVAAARSRNKRAIAAGKVNIQQASVSKLPFDDSSFDLVSAIETHYYWPEPVADLREILRVLKPGGRLVVIAETYKGETFDRLLVIPMALLRARYLSVREHEELLAAAGYVDVVIHTEARKGWICAVGRKRGGLAV
jgi:SAM-dependent methyltransferase